MHPTRDTLPVIKRNLAGGRMMPGVMPLKTMGRSQEKELRRLRNWRLFCGVVCAVVFLNFVAYLVGAGLVGGDAVSGEVEGGRYFVWGYLNHSWAKGYKEVSREVFNYSKWHGYSAIAGWPFLLIAAFARNRLRARISALEGPVAAAKGDG